MTHTFLCLVGASANIIEHVEIPLAFVLEGHSVLLQQIVNNLGAAQEANTIELNLNQLALQREETG